MNFRNLAIRALSGIIYVALIIGAIILGPFGVAVLASFFAIIGIYEIRKNTSTLGLSPLSQLFFIIEAVAAISLVFSPTIPLAAAGWLFLIFVRFFIQIFDTSENPLKTIAITGLSQLYIAFPMAAFALLSEMLHNSPWVLVALIAMIWINDTGAYLVGCSIGKHRLYERLSPKKSWEGFAGGLIFNVIAGIIFSLFLPMPFTMGPGNMSLWICTGILITILATSGDLFESMIKRSLGIKDSGNIIPGHGGILDRIDSLLFVAPGLVILFLFMGMAFY